MVSGYDKIPGGNGPDPWWFEPLMYVLSIAATAIILVFLVRSVLPP